MNARNESLLPALIFLWTWWTLSNFNLIGDYALFVAILLWLIGVLAQRMAGNALFRLKGKAWGWLLQLALWYAAFLWLSPLQTSDKILLLWGVATPLAMAGGACRWAYDRYPLLEPVFKSGPIVPPAALTFVLMAVFAWWAGNGLTTGLIVAALTSAFATIPLYYGWKLASPLPRGPRDARFGTEDSFRTAGMSDEG